MWCRINSFGGLAFIGYLHTMRTRFGIFFMYLILACILSENALPYFADSQAMECFEQKKECSEKEEKKGREVEDEWKALKEKNHLRFFRLT